MNYLKLFDLFVGLALKGIKSRMRNNKDFNKRKRFPWAKTPWRSVLI